MYTTMTSLEDMQIATKIAFIARPAAYTGLLPYLSPIFVTKEHPMTIPTKNKEPTRPSFHPAAQVKLS